MAQSLQTINISLPATMLSDVKDLVAAGHFASISEAIRAGINQIKVSLHPKYQNIKLGPQALKDFAQAEKDFDSGKTISFDTMDDLVRYSTNQLQKRNSKNAQNSPILSLSQKLPKISKSKS